MSTAKAKEAKQKRVADGVSQENCSLSEEQRISDQPAKKSKVEATSEGEGAAKKAKQQQVEVTSEVEQKANNPVPESPCSSTKRDVGSAFQSAAEESDTANVATQAVPSTPLMQPDFANAHGHPAAFHACPSVPLSVEDPAHDECGAGHRPSDGVALVPTSGKGPWHFGPMGGSDPSSDTVIAFFAPLL